MLRNADGGGGSDFPGKSVTKVQCSMLLALRGGGRGSNFQENFVTLEWPPRAFGMNIKLIYMISMASDLFGV